MEQELGVQLPAEVQVQAVEETADTIYLVLPSVSPAGEGGETLRPGPRQGGRRRPRPHIERRHLQHRSMRIFHLPR